uniref:NYN domain-containing protein n=1 Tax=Globisporangium ultimum (strain ATCC 200006 / CBS 805.95 / DAOM BR144) TaxID=431595 RepID=K3WNW5_GLOUD
MASVITDNPTDTLALDDGGQVKHDRISQQSVHMAIFWDIENCTVPSGMTGHVVVQHIRDALHEYGSTICFKAYFDFETGLVTSTLRSQLQGGGVSLTDAPHNRHKEAADKMLLVDMLTFAIDNPVPATIVLISGDSDFGYALSVLANRNYTVILITQHTGLPTQANILLDWKSDVLHVHDIVQPAHSTASKSTVQQPALNGFEVLVAVLKNLWTTDPRPLRSQVATAIVDRWPGVYQQVDGAHSFKQLTKEAATYDLVELGGEGGYSWIQLKDSVASKGIKRTCE